MTSFLIVVAVGRWAYLNSLSPDRNQAAAAAVIDIVTRYLRDGARVIAVLGLVVAAIAYLFEPAASGLRSVAPALRRHQTGLWLAFFGVCSLVILVSDQVTIGLALTMVAITVAGAVVIRRIFHAPSELVANTTPADGTGSQPVGPEAAPSER